MSLSVRARPQTDRKMNLSSNSAIAAALGGIQDAQNRTLEAAISIADSGVDALPDAAVALMMAKTQMQANAMTLRTLDQMQGSLLDLLA